MKQKQKVQIVADLTERFNNAKSVTFSEYQGLSVKQVNALRRKCHESQLDYVVAKNTLIELALPEDLREKAAPLLVNTTALTFDNESGVLGPKVISEFSKGHEFVKIKLGLLDGELLEASRVESLAKMPSHEELLAKILGSIQAPATNVLGCINAVGTKLAGLFRAYQEKLEKEAA